jgi:hypothetical protein
MECTNENPCGLCNICTLEEEIDACISTALYKNCESNKCTGCDHCNNCQHGEEINCCEICSPPYVYVCKHGNGEDCVTCEEIAQAQEDADAWQDSECKHGILERECDTCQANLEAAAERHRENQEWMHYHPAD